MKLYAGKTAKTSLPKLLCTMLISVFVCGAALAEQTVSGQADAAWQELSPLQDRFWKDAEDSPAIVERSAWPLINSLKHFIQYHPKSSHIPEAYYILGEAYSSISYTPEATAHWKTVVKYYPRSKWAGPALTALVRQLELKGNRQKILHFYQEILRQFPDSAASLMARVLLAEDALRQGRIKLVQLTVNKLEKIQSMELKVPEFLRLKAMLAERDGNYAQARDYLLHYLNLIKSRQLRASALFSIAESYRREGQILKARKYYALVRRDFRSEPEALFARFRLAQIEDRARGRLSLYVSSALKPEDMPATARLYSKIMRDYPSHPLTQEVQLELIRLRIRQGRYLDAVKLGHDFLTRLPDSVYIPQVRDYTLQAVDSLEKHAGTMAVLKDAVKFGLPVIKTADQDRVSRRIAEAVQKLWVRLLKKMTDEHQFEQALAQYRHYSAIYRGLHDDGAIREARPLGLEALRKFDAALLRHRRYTRLINYHFTHDDMMHELALSSHWAALAAAWNGISCPEAAMRAYYLAWQSEPPLTERCPLLNSWIECALNAGDTVTAEAALELLDYTCPDTAFSSRALEKKARLQVLKGRWREATTLFRDAVRDGGGISSQAGLFEGSIMTGDWETAGKLRKRIWEKISEKQKKHLLCLWGDEAFRLHNYRTAADAYEQLLEITPEDPSLAWRLARTRELAGNTEAAMDEFKALSQAGSTVWAKAADASLKNREFWNTVPEELR